MLQYKDYVAGWLDSTVHDFLKVFPPDAQSARVALLTCIDSHPAPASMLDSSPELRSLAGRIAPFGQYLLMPTELLVAHPDRLFFGFDEVWFFPSENIEPKPDSASLVGPNRIEESTLHSLELWMSSNGCSLAIADGAGLNFIVKAQGIVKHLLGHSLDLPRPLAASFPTSPEALAR